MIIRVAAGNPATRMAISGYDTGARQFYVEVDNFIGAVDTYFVGYNLTESGTPNSNDGDVVICLARNAFYFDGVFDVNVGSLATWDEGTITIGNTIIAGSTKFIGNIYAYAVYSDQLSAIEISEITTNMAALTSASSPIPTPWPVNYIIQNPATRRLNRSSHELWITTDGGIFHTIDGGLNWAQVNLPDPSNAEFVDSPAATVDELTFHWINYKPTDGNTLLVLAAKNSVSRMWGYKTIDLGLNWTSRGVIVA